METKILPASTSQELTYPSQDTLQKKNAYVCYAVFALPHPSKYFTEAQKPLISREDFLSKCLLSAARLNQKNIVEPKEPSTKFYFSDKAKAHSYRIPHTFNQLPEVFFKNPDEWLGIIGLQVYQGEKPEIKGFHQRSIGLKDIFNRNRVTQLYVCESYPRLDFLGRDELIEMKSPHKNFRRIEVQF